MAIVTRAVLSEDEEELLRFRATPFRMPVKDLSKKRSPGWYKSQPGFIELVRNKKTNKHRLTQRNQGTQVVKLNLAVGSNLRGTEVRRNTLR